MKKIIIILSAIIAVCGCSKEQSVGLLTNDNSNGIVSFTATFEGAGDPDTKVGINANGYLCWVDGDTIAVELTDGTFATFTLDTSTMKFTASLGDKKVKDGGKAYYPASIATSSTSVTLPATYTASVSDGLAIVKCPMVGTVNLGASSLNLTHLGGILSVKVSHVPADATKLILTATDKDVTGEFEVANDIITAGTSGTNKTVTLTFNAGDFGNTATEFFIPVPVTTFNSGFTVDFKNASNESLYSNATTKTSISVARAHIKRMAELAVQKYLYVSYDGAWDNFEGNTTTTYGFVENASDSDDILTSGLPGDAVNMSGTTYTHKSKSYIRFKDITDFQNTCNLIFHINWNNSDGGNPYADCLRAVLNNVEFSGDTYIRVAVPDSPASFKVYIRNWSSSGYMNRVYVWNSATGAYIINAWPGADFKNPSYSYQESLNGTTYTYVPVPSNTNIGIKGVYETGGNTDNQLSNKYYNDSSDQINGKKNVLYTMKGSNSDDQSWYWTFPAVVVSKE